MNKKKYKGSITIRLSPELHEQFSKKVKSHGQTHVWVGEQLIIKFLAGEIEL